MFTSIMQAVRLLAPMIGPIIKEIRQAQRDKSSAERQNTQFNLKLERARRNKQGKSVTELVKETRENA